MREYELVVLLHPDLEIDVDAPIKKIEDMITAASGKVTKRDNWGKRRLAYRVKKQNFAVYLYFEFEADPAKTRGLENALLLAEEVMRHLLVRHEEPVVKTGKPKAKETKKPADTTAAKEE